MILDLYFAQRFLGRLLGTLAVFFAILGLVDLIEQSRRFGGEAEGLGEILALVLLNAPGELYAILPMILMVAAIALFLGLARSSELVVARGAGRSGIRALLGPAAVVLLVGAAGAALVNPLVAATSREYDSRVARLEGGGRALSFSEDGLWLRQGGEDWAVVIHAGTASAGGTELAGATFLIFGPDDRLRERVEAARARLGDGEWHLEQVRAWPLDAENPEAGAEARATMTLPATLTAEQIREGLDDPSALPIWELPGFIARLEESGFAAAEHRVFLHREVAQPAFLLAMLAIAAVFTLRPHRGARVGVRVLGAILAGFGAFVLRDLSLVLGEAGQVPAALAVWAPTLAALGLALAALLHLEEG